MFFFVTGGVPAEIALPAFAVLAALVLHAPESTQRNEVWNLLLHVSGGFAGMDRELQLRSTGEFTAADRRRRTSTTGRLPEKTLADVDAIVSKLSSVASRRNPDCRDCLLYRIERGTPAGTTVVDLDDLTLAGTPLEPLVKTLTPVLNEALRP